MNAGSSIAPAVLYERLIARLRLRHLKLIDALATHSHLRRAAEVVHISQPAATQMLREVEGMLDMLLFERHARGMRITEAGRLFALHARMVIDSLRVATDELGALATQEARALHIGAIEAAVVSVLEPALAALHVRHPNLRLQIEENTIEQLTVGMRAGAFDVVLLRRPEVLEKGYRFVALRSDWMVVIAGASHPAAQRKRLRLRDLVDSRWVLPPAYYAVRQALDAAWAREKLLPREHPVQVRTPHLLRAMLAQPDVVVPVPHTVLDGLDQSTVVELKIKMHAPIEPLGMLYRLDDATGPLELLIDFLAACAKGKP